MLGGGRRFILFVTSVAAAAARAAEAAARAAEAEAAARAAGKDIYVHLSVLVVVWFRLCPVLSPFLVLVAGAKGGRSYYYYRLASSSPLVPRRVSFRFRVYIQLLRLEEAS